MNDPQLQFQLFDRRTRQYKSVYDICSKATVDYLKAQARQMRTPWRVARADRALKPAYRAPRYDGKTRTPLKVQEQYIDWAKAQGLKKITEYAERPVSWLAHALFDVVKIRLDDQMHVIEEHEPSVARFNAWEYAS